MYYKEKKTPIIIFTIIFKQNSIILLKTFYDFFNFSFIFLNIFLVFINFYR